MSDRHSPQRALHTLLDDPHAPASASAELLDGLTPEVRVRVLAGLRRRQLQALFARVAGFAPLSPQDLVPAAQPTLTPVRHVGHNSLPLFTNFEKRFYRSADGVLAGANFQSTSVLTGPGYFTVTPAPQPGECLIDYRKVPTQAPPDWPKIQDNDHGVGALVYGGAVDTLRRVSEHVSIGEARKHGGPPQAYFVLTRQDS